MFVAILVPDVVKTALSVPQSQLKGILEAGSCSWTKPENLHLTLRFIGDISQASVPSVSQRLRESLAGFGAMEFSCAGLGCFPNVRFPRVLWSGVQDAGNQLAELARRVDVAVRDFAKRPAESRFAGHLTLGRINRINRAETARLADFLAASRPERFGDWPVGAVALIRSELSPHGSRYTTLDVCPL